MNAKATYMGPSVGSARVFPYSQVVSFLGGSIWEPDPGSACGELDLSLFSVARSRQIILLRPVFVAAEVLHAGGRLGSRVMPPME